MERPFVKHLKGARVMEKKSYSRKEIKDVLVSLAHSQGFYGRLLRDV